MVDVPPTITAVPWGTKKTCVPPITVISPFGNEEVELPTIIPRPGDNVWLPMMTMIDPEVSTGVRVIRVLDS